MGLWEGGDSKQGGHSFIFMKYRMAVRTFADFTLCFRSCGTWGKFESHKCPPVATVSNTGYITGSGRAVQTTIQESMGFVTSLSLLSDHLWTQLWVKLTDVTYRPPRNSGAATQLSVFFSPFVMGSYNCVWEELLRHNLEPTESFYSSWLGLHSGMWVPNIALSI